MLFTFLIKILNFTFFCKLCSVYLLNAVEVPQYGYEEKHLRGPRFKLELTRSRGWRSTIILFYFVIGKLLQFS